MEITQNEIIGAPKLIIRPQTAKEEMTYLWFVLEKMPFYKEHNYSVVLPEHPVFENLAIIAPNFKDVNKDEVEQKLISLYDPKFYTNGLSILENERNLIESTLPELMKFNKEWGFKLFPELQLRLTQFGPGGFYNPDKGIVIMQTFKDGKFKRPNPAHTAIHEILHIGIQPLILKYKLTHLEKERVVDLIALARFGDQLPGYQLQDIGDSKVNPYITGETLNNLPQAMEKYVKDFPRV